MMKALNDKKRELVVNYISARRAGKKWEEQKVTCVEFDAADVTEAWRDDCPDTEIKLD